MRYVIISDKTHPFYNKVLVTFDTPNAEFIIEEKILCSAINQWIL